MLKIIVFSRNRQQIASFREEERKRIAEERNRIAMIQESGSRYKNLKTSLAMNYIFFKFINDNLHDIYS